jgi:hypothetical protein
MTRRWLAVLAGAATIISVLGACGVGPAGSGPDGTSDPPPAGVGIGDGQAPDPVSRTIGVTVQYAGFQYTIEDLRIEFTVIDNPFADEDDPPVISSVITINAGAGNIGVEQFRPSPTASIDWVGATGDRTVTVRSDFPDVPGLGSNRGTFAASLTPDLTADWDLDSAVLILGPPDVSRVTIPLGSSGELVTRMPQERPVDDVLTLGPLRLDVHTATAQWENLGNHRPTRQGMALVVLRFDVTSTDDTERCLLSARDFGLVLPGGGRVTAAELSRICVPAGGSITDAYAGFLVPDADLAGTHTFHVEATVGGDRPQGEVAFTVSG